MRFLWPALGLCACWWVIARCAGESDASTIPGVSQWSLTQQPMLDIGVETGDPVYELTDAASSLRLDDGGVVIADAGVGELRYFDAEGHFRFTATGSEHAERALPATGGRHRGVLRRSSGVEFDGVAFESAKRQFVFDERGSLIRIDSTTHTASRIHGRNLVLGGTAEAQERAVRALDRLAPIDSAAGYRVVRVDDGGYLWVEEPVADPRQRRPWQIYTPDARPAGRAMTPASFEPHQIGTTFILGRWRDGNGIEHIRMYGLKRDERKVASADSSAPLLATRTVDPGLQRTARAALKRALLSASRLQESYWASSMRYAPDVAALQLTLPEGMRVVVLESGVAGWRALAFDYAADVMCGIGVGRETPAGWEDGVPACN